MNFLNWKRIIFGAGLFLLLLGGESFAASASISNLRMNDYGSYIKVRATVVVRGMRGRKVKIRCKVKKGGSTLATARTVKYCRYSGTKFNVWFKFSDSVLTRRLSSGRTYYLYAYMYVNKYHSRYYMKRRYMKFKYKVGGSSYRRNNRRSSRRSSRRTSRSSGRRIIKITYLSGRSRRKYVKAVARVKIYGYKGQRFKLKVKMHMGGHFTVASKTKTLVPTYNRTHWKNIKLYFYRSTLRRGFRRAGRSYSRYKRKYFNISGYIYRYGRRKAWTRKRFYFSKASFKKDWQKPEIRPLSKEESLLAHRNLNSSAILKKSTWKEVCDTFLS